MTKTFAILATFAMLTITLFAADKAKIDQQAPDFTLKSSTGETVSLSDYEGKFVVLEWINFGCPFVVKHYDSDNMQELQKKWKAKGVVWLSICSSAPGKQGHMNSDEINKKLKEEKWKGEYYLIDEKGEVGKTYGAKTTPHMYVIDPSGKLVYAGAIDDIKSTDKDDVEKAKNFVDMALEAAFSGNEIKEKVTKPYGCSVKYL